MRLKDSFLFVIFGASGDLTERKLIPSLFELYCQDLLPEKFAIVGVSRTVFSDETFRDKLQNMLLGTLKNTAQRAHVAHFFAHLHYHAMDPSHEEEYAGLRKYLRDKTEELEIGGNYLFHLATPPNLYEPILKNLATSGLADEQEHQVFRRVIIEKPFGRDYDSACKLDMLIQDHYRMHQIYRIDHYLGKETVQNILVFRFANGIFEPIWNRMYIDHVEITAVEKEGVLTRGAYYDQAGALRDMIQNHLLQLLALIAMEPPTVFDAKMFRSEILKVLETIRPIEGERVEKQVVRGQYVANEDPNEETFAGYREEEHVASDSKTETFVAMKLFVDNWRWKSVPFYLRTGKSMATKVSEIVIHFKRTPHQVFCEDCKDQTVNKIVIRISPDEGILLRFAMKEPGTMFQVKSVGMDFKYDEIAERFQDNAYEKLIYDCLCGDSMLFTQSDELMASWKLLNPILEQWNQGEKIPLYGYPVGSWGPEEADQLLPVGEHWTNPCKNLTNSDNYCLL